MRMQLSQLLALMSGKINNGYPTAPLADACRFGQRLCRILSIMENLVHHDGVELLRTEWQ